jgi:uncharacterized protein
MAKSLQDQLKKNGLVSAHDARKASAKKRKDQRKHRAGHEDEDTARKAALAEANAKAKARDGELNRARQAQAEERAVAAQVVQLVEMNRLERGKDADVAFNYVETGSVRHLYVTPEQHRALTAGQLALVQHGDGPALVPTAVAEKIRLRDASTILALNERTDDADVDVDDPYADFQVPDDLMW